MKKKCHPLKCCDPILHNWMKDHNSDSQSSKVPFGVNLIRNCILIFAIILTVGIFLEILIGFSVLGIEGLFRTALQCGIFWIIFYGLKKVTSWAVILVLICSYFGFLIFILEFIQTNVVNGYDLLKKFFQLCLTFFYAFQILIFSRSETKRYFREKETTVVS